MGCYLSCVICKIDVKAMDTIVRSNIYLHMHPGTLRNRMLPSEVLPCGAHKATMKVILLKGKTNIVAGLLLPFVDSSTRDDMLGKMKFNQHRSNHRSTRSIPETTTSRFGIPHENSWYS